jgi:hypothetical protein
MTAEHTTIFQQKYENEIWKGYTKFLPEAIAVSIGRKPVMRIPVSSKFGYDKFRQLCSRMNLVTGLSDYKIKEPYTKNDILPANSSVGDNFIYVSLAKELINKAKRYDLVDEQKFGELMGYPQCCIDYYDKIMRDRPNHEIYSYLILGKKLDWHNNYLLRFNSNYYLHAYFTCSFDCKESLKNGKEILHGIREYDELFARKIEYHLKLPIVFDDSKDGAIIDNWDRLKGVVFNGIFKGNTIDYNGQFSLWQGSHFPVFSDGNRIKIGDKEITLFKDDSIVKKFEVHNPYQKCIINFG